MQTKKSYVKVLFGSLVLTLLSLILTVSVKAQGPAMQSPEDRAATMTAKMKSELSLTDAQYPQVQALNLKYAQKADSVYKSPGERSDKMTSMQSIMQAKGTEMQGILTADQYTKYQAMVKEMRDKARAMSSGN